MTCASIRPKVSHNNRCFAGCMLIGSSPMSLGRGQCYIDELLFSAIEHQCMGPGSFVLAPNLAGKSSSLGSNGRAQCLVPSICWGNYTAAELIPPPSPSSPVAVCANFRGSISARWPCASSSGLVTLAAGNCCCSGVIIGSWVGADSTRASRPKDTFQCEVRSLHIGQRPHHIP